MGGGSNKKNKRGSIPSSSSSSTTHGTSGTASPQQPITASTKIELIERTEENDYGVMSDPEENYNSSPIPLLTKEHPPHQAMEEEPQVEEPVAVVAAVAEEKLPTDTQSEQLQTQHLLQHSSQSSQQPDPSIQPSTQPSTQPQISQPQSLKSLELKLTTDKNFSKKITLHSFFSYIILAIELQRASISASSLSRISINEVENLVEYMIEHHSASEEIRIYLRTLNKNGIITNMISAIIDFNTAENNDSESFDKLFLSEIEMTATATTSATTTAATTLQVQDTPTSAASAASASTNTTDDAPQPRRQSQKGFFKCMRCFFSGCCG
jgi:hypothetical protein